MKKTFILISIFIFTLSSYAQTVTNINTTVAIVCNGGQATINVTTNASSTFDYLKIYNNEKV